MLTILPKIMNHDMLTTVHGYAGDAGQIANNLPWLLHHEVPVMVFSPEDSPITNFGKPGIEYRLGGRRAYIGNDSLKRQHIHLKQMLDTPFKFFLCNDSDSICLAQELPDYCFKEDVLWSNEVSDMMHQRQPGYFWPRLALQPPYFFSRNVLEQLVRADEGLSYDQQTPFIDWVMMAWAVKGNIPHKSYPHGVSCPTRNYPPGIAHMRHLVRHNGAAFLHSIKDEFVLRIMAREREFYIHQYHPKDKRKISVNRRTR